MKQAQETNDFNCLKSYYPLEYKCVNIYHYNLYFKVTAAKIQVYKFKTQKCIKKNDSRNIENRVFSLVPVGLK